ncbi:MAG TPA: response regulator transcription factor [Hymenobacter sp.]|uniref:response regulator transcription factor n=1 Tax=Hymenobacter sp. TaxID=1898978 RepID=UPI002D7F2028|nr:response regulator transcription factor [Hymenobacter sp.]HET9504024.1 response regulator transcription factor [Hymenobacter sp.]
MARIFLAGDDGDPLGRDSVGGRLALEPGLLLVGAARTGPALLDQLLATQAEVVVLALAGPLPEGLAAVQGLRAALPEMKILVLAASTSERDISQLFAAGVHGYVLQDGLGEELVVAIRTVAAGRQFLCSGLGLLLLHKLLAKATGTSLSDAAAPGPPQLTRREAEILRLLSEGLTTGEIADQLFTSKRTVETHRQNILEKTQTKNTAALIRLAMTQGLLD